MENSERVIATIVSETGKTYEDAEFAEIAYAGNAFGFWAKNAPDYLADERVKSASVMLKGKKLILRYRPLGLIGVIGPWNYPLTNSFGDCIPALGGRQQRDPQALRGHAADLARCSPRVCASAGCPTASSRSPPVAVPPARP